MAHRWQTSNHWGRTPNRPGGWHRSGNDRTRGNIVGIVKAVNPHGTDRSPSSTALRLAGALVVLVVTLSACATVERKPIRLAPTPTADPGVRVIVDNCPGPSAVTLLVRDEIIWEAEAPTEATTETDSDANPEEGTDTVATDTSAPDTDTSVVAGLLEVVVGQPPDGWIETQPLSEGLRSDIRYTVVTEPDEQRVDFAIPDLAQGLLFDGVGRSQFNQDLMQAPCSEPADVGRFVGNLAVLGLLGITSAAFVLVALISLLFVVTRRFGRIQSLERKAQRPSTRSNS